MPSSGFTGRQSSEPLSRNCTPQLTIYDSNRQIPEPAVVWNIGALNRIFDRVRRFVLVQSSGN